MIRYHGLPMTPVLALVRAMQGKHAMVSFERPEQLPEAVEVCQSVALDNGAFSAWKSGKPYDFRGYQAWCIQWLRHPAVDWCVIPDVIDGDEAANDALLAEWSIPGEVSVPVYHLHESLQRLARLVDTYPRVALGSSGTYSDPGSSAWWGRMAEMMNLICDDDGFPQVKLHGLRMLDPVLFAHLPFASADSCNVSRNIGYDQRWTGSYLPASKATKAMIMIERLEHHAVAHRWNEESCGVQQNMELIG